MGEIQLLETIRYEGGTCRLLDLHEERMLRSLKALAPMSSMFQRLKSKGLEQLIKEWQGAEVLFQGLELGQTYKLRLIYDEKQICHLEALAYSPLRVEKLWLYEVGTDFSYEHKFLERTCLNPFNEAENSKPKIPLFIKEGLLTDSSFTNIILRFGEELLTPRKPLLRGVMREHLLREGRLREEDLGLEALKSCDEVLLINVMLPLERAISVREFSAD